MHFSEDNIFLRYTIFQYNNVCGISFFWQYKCLYSTSIKDLINLNYLRSIEMNMMNSLNSEK